uniref:Uncharacterized protein n=1 Tax=Percolomonas cosmopolitus TaxID=63605 RepID=A0A7S1KTI8_9EUKA
MHKLTGETVKQIKIIDTERFVRFYYFSGHFFIWVMNFVMAIVGFTEFALNPVTYFDSTPKTTCQPLPIGILMLVEGSLASIFTVVSFVWWLHSKNHFDEIFKRINFKPNPDYANEILSNDRIRMCWKISTPVVNFFMWGVQAAIGIATAVFAFQPGCKDEAYWSNNLVFTIILLSFAGLFPIYLASVWVGRWWFGTVTPKYYTESAWSWEKAKKKAAVEHAEAEIEADKAR